MNEQQVQAGFVPFNIPGVDIPCSTYYKVFGDLQSGQPAVIGLHGGPGSGHEYMEPFGLLWQRYRVPTIIYDQIGCASSTRLPQKAGDKKFWTPDLFVQELDNLIDTLHLRDEGRPGYHILGHSWGGLLGSYFASKRPRGLQKLILANAVATFDIHAVCVWDCYKKLGPEAEQAAKDALRTGDFKSKAYKEAESAMMRTFWCRSDPWPPQELKERFRRGAEGNPTAETMFGAVFLECTGSMHGWDRSDDFRRITAPTLVYNGEFDIEQDKAIAPFLTNIPGARKVTIAGTSHMSHLDNAASQVKTLELVASFLQPDVSSLETKVISPEFGS